MIPIIFECEHCGKNVCNVCYCTGSPTVSIPNPVVKKADLLDPLYHALWQELHTQIQTKEQFAQWAKRVPELGCGCESWLKSYLSQNPISDDIREYGWKLHNAVNQKIGKAEFSKKRFDEKHPAWKQVDGHRIGIAAINYEAMGGTETFHQSLVPRLENVIGFASQNGLRGDTQLLGVPTGQGVEAIASLALQSDTVISWNIDWTDKPRPKRLITVHHGSLSDLPSTVLCLQGDVVVCVNREVAEHVKTLTDKPVHCIDPAVDPDRVKPRQAVETNGKKICLWSHRFAKDKQPQLAIEIAAHLPADWHMVLTGHRGEKLELSDRVTVLPPQHPGDWLAVADCFLSTSLFEGFGLSVAEAITAGAPVVSSPVGIATRPALATVVPMDASPADWAEAILASQNVDLPSRDLFGVEAFLTAWNGVVFAKH